MRIHGIFKTSCPSGWTRQTAWDGKHLRGGGAYGGTGGTTDSHTHTATVPSVTSAGIEPSVNNLCPSDVKFPLVRLHYHSIPSRALTTEVETYTPPYINVVFCYQDV